MKIIISTLLCTFLFQFINAQTEGTIVYKETVKLDIQFEGMDESMKAMLPKSQSVTKVLTFKGKESLYQNKKGEELENINMASDDGSFQIKIMRDDTEDILYKNLKEKTKIHQKGMMGKSFVVKDELPKHKWKITNEKIKFLDYECQKAVIEEEGKFVVAWFTSQIPVQVGPGSYHGLPGAILLISINEGETEVAALGVDFNALNPDDMKAPSDGKEVTEEEFEKIRIEKEKEMEETYGGKRMKIKH